MKVIFCFMLAIFWANAEDVRLDNLDPAEAAQIIESKDQSLKYAPKIDTNVPAVRVLGKDHYNVLEDIYLANQYHGQDGVGGYLYGYSVPDIAKTEKKQAGGDLKGAYNYVNGDGQEIKVEYWDDGTGFHQIDNVPRILPQQIEDTPEVKAAKEEHARIWAEQAERNSRAPADPNANAYSAYDDGSDNYPQKGYIQNPGQSQPAPGPYPAPYSLDRPTPAPYSGQGASSSQYVQQGPPVLVSGSYSGKVGPAGASASYQGRSQYAPPAQASYSGQTSQSSSQYAAAQPPAAANSVEYSGQYSEQRQSYAQGPGGKQSEEPEGPPHGFFYSFDYPVGIIVQNQGRALDKREDINQFYDKNKEKLQKQLENHGDYRLKRSVPVVVYTY